MKIDPSLMTDAELREALRLARESWLLARDAEVQACWKFNGLVIEAMARPWGAARPVPGRVRGKRRGFNAGRTP